MNNLFTIREATKEDESLIYSTWLLGLRHGNDWFLSVPKEIYFNNYKQVIAHLLKSATVRVACLVEDPDVALGYAVLRGNTLDWVFVKRAFRRLGIAKALVPENISTCSHLTKIGKSLKPDKMVFNPFFT